MTDISSVVNTWYNGLVIQVKHRFSHGFQMDAGFTWSKAQDDDQNSQTFTTSESASNPINLKNDYSLSDFDQRKRFTLSGVWELPTHNIQSKMPQARGGWLPDFRHPVPGGRPAVFRRHHGQSRRRRA